MRLSEVGKALHETLLESKPKTHTGKCRNCGYTLELYEIDFKKEMRVLRCQRCGLFHFYKKDIIGRWRIIKAARLEMQR